MLPKLHPPHRAAAAHTVCLCDAQRSAEAQLCPAASKLPPLPLQCRPKPTSPMIGVFCSDLTGTMHVDACCTSLGGKLIRAYTQPEQECEDVHACVYMCVSMRCVLSTLRQASLWPLCQATHPQTDTGATTPTTTAAKPHTNNTQDVQLPSDLNQLLAAREDNNNSMRALRGGLLALQHVARQPYGCHVTTASPLRAATCLLHENYSSLCNQNPH